MYKFCNENKIKNNVSYKSDDKVGVVVHPLITVWVFVGLVAVFNF